MNIVDWLYSRWCNS